MASSDVSSSLASLLRLASWIICLIVAASFLIFVVEQTSSASTHQQEELIERPSPGKAPKVKHESTVHKTIDEAANFFTSPFSGVVSGSNSQWVIHGVTTFLALLIYGLGLSYLSRVIRVRV
jgi:uncharacterized membrane protein YbjE (DUF340 family)